ncbi:MAG TPA: acylphosphatase, partial [Solirubrobacteraceae bacterium]|nr:acylphosphatase [Solirubrobacteraceae bacterium]
MAKRTKAQEAIRAALPADGRGSELISNVVARAGGLDLLGWVREDPDGVVRIHAEGARGGPAALVEQVQAAAGTTDINVESV